MLIGQARRNHVLRGLLAAAAVVIVIAGLRAARPVLVPMLVAAFVALACVPMVHGLRRRLIPADEMQDGVLFDAIRIALADQRLADEKDPSDGNHRHQPQAPALLGPELPGQ